jgi:tripartite-type tricarboxylate transporter receptor subunit TctC
LAGFEFNSWFAMVAPAGTPKAVLQKVQSEVVKALADASVREQLMAQGLSPRGSSPEDLGSALRAQLSRYETLIKQAGITAD